LAQAESELTAAREEAAASLAEAKQELEDGESQLAEGQAEYDESYAEYLQSRAEAAAKIEDGENRILNAKNNYNDIVTGKWYFFDRNDVIENYSGFNLDAERIDAIASIFPVFFLLIAALVCLTTMSRMIDEQRTQMGIYKALGYPSKDIIGKYIIYSALAGISGSVIGQVICIQILPRAIFDAYSTLYRLPPLIITVPWMMSLISFLVALACTVMVAWYSCYRELRVNTASLMRPKSPKIGKRIFLENWPALWKSLSFSKKITARNLFRFKVRLTMTIVGIAGCMALVVAGFGLQDAINPIVDKQYGDIFKYDMMIALGKSLPTEDAQELRSELNADSRINETMFMRYMSGSASLDEDTTIKDIYVVVRTTRTFFRI
jgi:putative ABC transport system permease protein